MWRVVVVLNMLSLAGDIVQMFGCCFKSALLESLDFSFLVLYILAYLISFLEIQRLQLAGSSSTVFAVFCRAQLDYVKSEPPTSPLFNRLAVSSLARRSNSRLAELRGLTRFSLLWAACILREDFIRFYLTVFET